MEKRIEIYESSVSENDEDLIFSDVLEILSEENFVSGIFEKNGHWFHDKYGTRKFIPYFKIGKILFRG